LPDRDGLSVLAELRERYPAISVVVLSALQDRANVQKVLDLGDRMRCRECDERGRAVVSIRWAT